jgi:hypothetical protein
MQLSMLDVGEQKHSPTEQRLAVLVVKGGWRERTVGGVVVVHGNCQLLEVSAHLGLVGGLSQSLDGGHQAEEDHSPAKVDHDTPAGELPSAGTERQAGESQAGGTSDACGHDRERPEAQGQDGKHKTSKRHDAVPPLFSP